MKSFFFFFRNSFARFVSRFVILRSPRHRHVAPVPGDGRARLRSRWTARATGFAPRASPRCGRRFSRRCSAAAPRRGSWRRTPPRSPRRRRCARCDVPLSPSPASAPPEPRVSPPGRELGALASGAPASTRRRLLDYVAATAVGLMVLVLALAAAPGGLDAVDARARAALDAVAEALGLRSESARWVIKVVTVGGTLALSGGRRCRDPGARLGRRLRRLRVRRVSRVRGPRGFERSALDGPYGPYAPDGRGTHVPSVR